MKTMRIHGIGIDIVDTARIEESIDRFGDRFIDRIFTAAEKAYCAPMSAAGRHYAARFAAKEAIAKALGTGIGADLAWTDMEILRNANGKPGANLTGAGKAFMDRNGIVEIQISLSHADNHAAANAIAIAYD
ncbi:MAG: holo-ACP synthase [Verrucomicrobiales bacterium]|nr:holo-ACP synthase [Verrucomicrobiales bacterium]